MNAINVVPKTVVVVPARTTEVATVTWRTLDDAFNKRLRIQVNGSVAITVEGADYDALGQWTDETVKQIILTRLQLVEATPA
jgi:ABC-type phosphate/phosphonate transport system substrate-binding protein